MVHENSLKNLKTITSTEMAKELGSKGGSVKSENKSLARKLDWLKRKGMTDEQVLGLHDMLTDEDVSDITILEYIKTLKEMADVSGDFNKIQSTLLLLLKWRKERFGSRVKVEGTIKVDWSTDVDRILDSCKIIDVKSEVEK